ncbi:hypothetical protein [Sorangium sp. So ce1097]|uniref:hypothetical protein n=1 Tax=Sorangium sp. So ce1097 TaxID=3133330 RepID=UPI003F5D741D
MRFAFFSSLISRSSTARSAISRSSAARSSLQGLVALSALVVLTGAKGQGCGGVVVEEPQPPPEPDCGPGFHWESVCSPCELGEMCEMQCVPDNVCPRGWLEQTVCGGSTTVGQGGAAGGVGMPADPGCWTECVPPPPMCPPGTVEQVACGGSSTSSTTGGGGWGSASSSVGAGGSGGGIGGSDPGAAPPPDMCWTECVPVGPMCPPGTREHTVCSGSSSSSSSSSTGVGGSGGWGGSGGAGAAGGWGGSGGAGAAGGWGGSGGAGGWGGSGGAGGSGGWIGTGGAGAPVPPNPIDGCWTECVPVEPYCPPGTREQTVCSGSSSSSGYGDGDFEAPIPGTSGSSGTGYGGSGGAYPGGGCWTECIPVEPYCPPNTRPATVCEDPMPGTSSSSGYGDGDFETPMPGTSGSSGTGYGGSGGGYPGGGCWTECIPVEPYCPPGMTEQKVCSGAGTDTGTGGAGAAGAEGEAGGCWFECLEEPTCPPEAIVRTICEEPSGGGGFGPVCRTECVLMLP